MSNLWKELHERAYNFKGKDDTVFLKNFATKIPRYTRGCKCREFWLIYVRSHPPIFGKNGEGYFKWSIDCHNAVNLKLKKPVISLEDAKKLYSYLEK
jgi:Erv1 / Alr family